MKIHALAASCLALALASPAFAAPRVHSVIDNHGIHEASPCGWPTWGRGNPACAAGGGANPTPVNVQPAPAPAPTGPCASTDTKCVVKAMLANQPQFISDIKQAVDTQASILNAAGAAWDPDAIMCANGVPAMGTPGQPGYVPTAEGLIAWVQGLQAPAVTQVPALPGPKTAVCTANPGTDFCTAPSAATVLEHAYLLAVAAESDANNVISMINNGGIPAPVKESCGAKVQDIINVGTTAATQATAFVALLSKFLAVVPK